MQLNHDTIAWINIKHERYSMQFKMNKQSNGINAGQNQLLTTMTGEIIQPVRIYYKIKDKSAVKRVFSKLKCVDFDANNDRFVWQYEKEAKKLKFDKPYADIPAAYHPLVIGAFFTSETDEMYLETRSFERALAAIPFFDKYLKNYMAEISDIAIINRLFSSEDGIEGFNELFKNAKIINPEEKLAEFERLIKQGNTIESILADKKQSRLPLAERFPSNFYEDGIDALKFTFQGRKYVAMQHWNGNTEYTLGDYISEVTNL
jgi:hypothetical protein